MIHDGSSRNRGVASRDGRAEPRRPGAYLKPYVEGLSGEPARQHARQSHAGLSQPRPVCGRGPQAGERGGFWGTLTPEQREGIEAIAMDMWAPAIQSTQAHLDGAEATIVFDKFHLAKHLHEAVDGVRRADQRALKQAGDNGLTGTKYLWLMRPQAMT